MKFLPLCRQKLRQYSDCIFGQCNFPLSYELSLLPCRALELRVTTIQAHIQLNLSLSFCLQWGKNFMFVRGLPMQTDNAQNSFQNKPWGMQPLFSLFKTSCWLQNKSSDLAWPSQARICQSVTFDLKSTGGFAQAALSPCRAETREHSIVLIMTLIVIIITKVTTCSLRGSKLLPASYYRLR